MPLASRVVMSVDFGASVNALVQWGFLLLLVILFVAFTSRSGRRQRENIADMHNSLEIGDEVVTSSGIFGSVAQLADARIGLEIAPGIVIEIARQAIARKVTDAELGRDTESSDDAETSEDSEASDD